MTVNHSRRLYQDSITRTEKLRRLAWRIVYLTIFYPTPNVGFGRWRLFLLKCFGAKIGNHCKVASTARVWAPWNLILRDRVCLAEQVEIYSVEKIELSDHVTISQRATLCSASHDIQSLARPLTKSPIKVGKHAWVCAEAFVGPGVEIGEGAVVGARAVVMRDVPSWNVVAGNPAKFVKQRTITDSE